MIDYLIEERKKHHGFLIMLETINKKIKVKNLFACKTMEQLPWTTCPVNANRVFFLGNSLLSKMVDFKKKHCL